MTGLEIIGLISGIASIISIPLAFYFDRKNELNKYENAKRRIIETLLHQIGSGQALDLLGMKLIIDSKLREAGLRPGRISIQEIISDIYTNVTTNPLIESKQKSTYQNQIKKLGLSNTINNTIDSIRDTKKLPLGDKVENEVLVKLEHLDYKQKIEYLKEHGLLEIKSQVSYISNKKNQLRLYSLLSTLISILTAVSSLFFYKDFLVKVSDSFNPILVYIMISVFVGILITFLASFYSRIRSRRDSDFDNLNEFIHIDNYEEK